MMPSRRRFKDLTLDQIKKLPKEQLQENPSMSDLLAAATSVPRTVSDVELGRYDEWMEEFGSA